MCEPGSSGKICGRWTAYWWDNKYLAGPNGISVYLLVSKKSIVRVICVIDLICHVKQLSYNVSLCSNQLMYMFYFEVYCTLPLCLMDEWRLMTDHIMHVLLWRERWECRLCSNCCRQWSLVLPFPKWEYSYFWSRADHALDQNISGLALLSTYA